MLVPVKQLKKESNQLPAGKKDLFDYSDEVVKEPAEKPLIKEITKGNILSRDENLDKRKEMIEAKGFEPTDFAFERAIGKNDSLYSNFTELVALTKRKVGRIVIVEDGKRTGFATGFMVSKNLLLTNWHVFKTEAMAIESEIQFFYEYDVQGHPGSPVIFKLDTKKFYQSNEGLDYCFVGVQSIDTTGKVLLENIGYLFLDKALGKIGDVNVERLNIIHHPLGDYKQISIRENLFVDIDDTKIFYETDTAQGSSGSPVFNDQWQVVGLHHKSIAKMTPDGFNYLDKDDKIIPVIDNKIDSTRIVWLKNEGMRISVILNHLAETNPANELIAAINMQPPQESLSFTINNTGNSIKNNKTTAMSNDFGKNINISVPVSALSSESTIDISLSSKKNIPVAVIANKSDTVPKDAQDELLLETAKVEKEQNADFSNCRGYDSMFLGVEISLPQPRKSIEKQIALLKNKSNEFKYFKYSVIFNAVRKMPLISAVNAEGDASKRLDNSKRSDDWLRDSRIDIEAQLTDKFYASSRFDKGHMSRFEDANWDNTEEKALRNGIYTCFYTNACPQVPGINRMGDNLWGKLEKAVLEKGIKKETGKQARMTVFNGPVFDEEKDRIRKGVTVPMQFFKIILWLNDDNELKATAFKLSQELLVTDDQFVESMMLGEEALDIDKLVSYKKYQCSIKSLGILTKINFDHLEQFDTYRTHAGSNETLLDNEETIML
ncbi:MAG TPA: DNA/RNA non-specific endonuclease [Panacibacter sp.]|nr:DNA/RNA non-specific endonuclease [Panacibacter sp.]